MIRIQDTLVSLDLVTEKFVCDLLSCCGCCCVEGDAGAPVELEEIAQLEEVLPIIWENLTENAKNVINRQGVVYTDSQGDLVTSIVNGRDCVFAKQEADGCTYCAIERAYRAGKTKFYKPISCHLYPVRLTNYGAYIAVNYNKWDICKAAVLLGHKCNTPLYRFLKEPLIRKFGHEWYDELELVATEMKKQQMV